VSDFEAVFPFIKKEREAEEARRKETAAKKLKFLKDLLEVMEREAVEA